MVRPHAFVSTYPVALSLPRYPAWRKGVASPRVPDTPIMPLISERIERPNSQHCCVMC